MEKHIWNVDRDHTEIGFKVKHMMISNVKGKFDDYDIQVETIGDDFSKADVTLTIKTKSVNTSNEQRDNHLRSADFFDSEKFPDMIFKSTEVNDWDGEEFSLIGDLTIKDITKQVKLKGEFGGLLKDPWGNMKAGFTVTGKINRKDWGLVWNAALEAGGVLVADDINLICEIELSK